MGSRLIFPPYFCDGRPGGGPVGYRPQFVRIWIQRFLEKWIDFPNKTIFGIFSVIPGLSTPRALTRDTKFKYEEEKKPGHHNKTRAKTFPMSFFRHKSGFPIQEIHPKNLLSDFLRKHDVSV